MPTISAHVPEDWPHLTSYRERIAARYRGKDSPYILDLIERDLKIVALQPNEEPVTADQVLLHLRMDLALNLLSEKAVEYLREMDAQKKAVLGTELALDLIQAVLKPEVLAAEDTPAPQLSKLVKPKTGAGSKSASDVGGTHPPKPPGRQK